MAIIPKHKHPNLTLRSLRHAAPQSARAAPAKVRSTANLTVKEKLARRGLKPLIQGRQFKWISPREKIKAMVVDLGAVRDRRNRLEGDTGEDLAETHSLFSHALNASCLLNLSLPFIAFYRSLEPKCRSLPLVIHNRDTIVKIICATLRGPTTQVELCGETLLE